MISEITTPASCFLGWMRSTSSCLTTPSWTMALANCFCTPNRLAACSIMGATTKKAKNVSTTPMIKIPKSPIVLRFLLLMFE